MRDSIYKVSLFLFPIVSYLLISCSATLPLQEISKAKQEVTRAKLFNSERYAKAEFDDSRLHLLKAHESALNPALDLKKVTQLAQVSTEKAKEAINKSIPSYVKDLQKEVEVALESANGTFAEVLASDIYEQAVLLKSEGDELVKNADTKQANLTKDDDTGKAVLYEEYEKGIKRYRESIAASEKARDLSLAQTQAIIESSSDIESNLDLIEKYSNENKTMTEKSAALREEYKLAVEQMEKGELRDGFKKLEKIRTGSNELMTSVILPYAKGRIKTATIKIEDADNFLHSDADNAKSSVASDNLTASKEAFTASVDLLAKERYYDSIQQSDESIRLAEEVLKSRESVKNSTVVAKKRSTKNKSEEDNEFKKSFAKEIKKDCSDAECKDSNKKECTEECKDISNKDKKECSEADCKDKESSKTKPAKLKPVNVTKPVTSTSTVQWKKHIVQKKIPPETLWRIAADKKYYGNKDLWHEIYKANKKNISNPNRIYPNQVILIPTKTDKSVSKKSTKVKK